MTSARSEASAARLADGRVLITVGFDQGQRVGLGTISRVPINTAEVFDPKTNIFTATSPMLKARYVHSSVLLEDRKSSRHVGENSVLEGNVLQTNRTLEARRSRGPNRQLTYFLATPIQ